MIVLAIAAVGWWLAPAPARVEPHPIAPVAVVAPTDGLEAVIVSTEGEVEKESDEGSWKKVAVGDRLGADDSLRTGGTGRAELKIGDKSQLTVTENTQLKVRELTRAVHQVQLAKGRLVARYDADGERVLRIEDEKGSAVAETKAAKFSILSNGTALAVATETGKVNLGAAGKTVDVAAGQQAIVRAGEAPSAPAPIPAEVWLKVAAMARIDKALCAVVEGSVDPGSEVAIDGAPVAVDPKGAFSADVPRKPNQVAARVAVRDISGRPRETMVACRKEPAAPPVKLKINWSDADAG